MADGSRIIVTADVELRGLDALEHNSSPADSRDEQKINCSSGVTDPPARCPEMAVGEQETRFRGFMEQTRAGGHVIPGPSSKVQSTPEVERNSGQAPQRYTRGGAEDGIEVQESGITEMVPLYQEQNHPLPGATSNKASTSSVQLKWWMIIALAASMVVLIIAIFLIIIFLF